MIFSLVCINFGPELQGGGWAEGGEGRVGVGGGEGGGKPHPGEDTGPPVALRWS